MYWLTQSGNARRLINVIHRSIKPQPLTGQGHPRALTGVGRQASRNTSLRLPSAITDSISNVFKLLTYC